MTHYIHSFLIAGLLTWQLTGAEEIADYKPLLDDSPFLTMAFKERLAKPKVGGMDNYTFNGYTYQDGQWQLCLINQKTKIAVWTSVNEVVEGFTVKAFHPDKQSIEFDKQGVAVTLTMDKPK